MTTAPVGQIVMLIVGILAIAPFITRHFRTWGKK